MKGKSRRFIIPVFLPNKGCPQRCIYCNQKEVSSYSTFPKREDILRKTDMLLKTFNSSKWEGLPQIAFYGSSFTALNKKTQSYYLQIAKELIDKGKIKDIRLATRPDYISKDLLCFLGNYSVETIELGIQSLDDDILSIVDRGHNAEASICAIRLLKEHGYKVGGHLMVGLPGERGGSFIDTLGKVIDLKVDFLRIHPLIIIKNTVLERLYLSEKYKPMTIPETVQILKKAILICRINNVPIARLGIHLTEGLIAGKSIVAGPVHPALGYIIESELYYDALALGIKENITKHGRELSVLVQERELSLYLGYKRGNIERIKREYPLCEVNITGDIEIAEGQFFVNSKRYDLLSLLNNW